MNSPVGLNHAYIIVNKLHLNILDTTLHFNRKESESIAERFNEYYHMDNMVVMTLQDYLEKLNQIISNMEGADRGY